MKRVLAISATSEVPCSVRHHALPLGIHQGEKGERAKWGRICQEEEGEHVSVMSGLVACQDFLLADERFLEETPSPVDGSTDAFLKQGHRLLCHHHKIRSQQRVHVDTLHWEAVHRTQIADRATKIVLQRER